MKRFSNSIRAAVAAENWFGALFLALAIPDVCGALEDPDARVGDRYKQWFNRYLKQRYSASNPYEQLRAIDPDVLQGMTVDMVEQLKTMPFPEGTQFTAEDCYRFRCKCLHQGLAQKMGDEKILFTAPRWSGVAGLVHSNAIDGVYQLQIDRFCLDVCEALDHWIADVRGNEEVQRRMKDLIQVHY
ncbi:hypothetical protein K6W76_09755 [Burkholderia anthina]|uniref:hypothetical protein n=1 Tax=Burkholderia anthina TaxID=179879 RepID=UPI00158A9ED0|nr:hypothetical protein [Burkholderia anthina]MBY4866792.1 hypothetical protein [Burkholderia anthina]